MFVFITIDLAMCDASKLLSVAECCFVVVFLSLKVCKLKGSVRLEGI